MHYQMLHSIHFILHRPYWIVLVIILLLLSVIATPAHSTETQPAAQTTLYLPMLASRVEAPVFGIEMRRIRHENGLNMAASTGNHWVRRNALRWKDVETREGQPYDWNNTLIRWLDQELINARQAGMEVILIVNASPPWAVEPYNADCAPINPSKYAAFAEFMAAAVERYSKPPYNVTYWEIGNEPDAYVFPQNSVYGCWGIESDEYYGGRAYGEMLKVVVPAMRAANPNIKILNGGLLLARPYDAETGANRSARFLEGVFVAGAAQMFDILSYHHYIYYGGEKQDLTLNDDWKVDYLRDMMRRYNVPEKPLMKTETALLCFSVTPECRWAQADAVARFHVRALRDELLGVIWYHYDGDTYYYTGFIEPTEDPVMPRPAFFAYRHAAQMLGSARFEQVLDGLPPGAEGYLLKRDTGHVIVGWANQPTSVTVPIPANRTVTCTDRDGGAFPCSPVNGRLTVELYRSPIYISY